MMRTLIVIAALCALPATAVAQWTTPRSAGFYTRLLQSQGAGNAWRTMGRVTARGDTTPRLRLDQSDSASRRVCPMPVAAPDSASLAPMPKVGLDPARSASMPRVEVSCFNPLFPGKR